MVDFVNERTGTERMVGGDLKKEAGRWSTSMSSRPFMAAVAWRRRRRHRGRLHRAHAEIMAHRRYAAGGEHVW